MDWREILKTNVTHAGELEDIMHLNGEHEQEVERILERFPMSVPRYYLSLIDWNNPKDPIRRMCIPSLEENDMTGKFDTSGEAENTRLPGLQHKYGETALIPVSYTHLDVYKRQLQQIAEIFAENLKRFQAGEPLRNVVDLETGYCK